MKTTMQQLLDIVYNSIYQAKLLKDNGLNKPDDINIMLNIYNVFRVIIERDMIEKEKQQIIDAHFEGWSDAYDYLKDDFSSPRQAEDYYNETYNK